jgi:hypothetical protein
MRMMHALPRTTRERQRTPTTMSPADPVTADRRLVRSEAMGRLIGAIDRCLRAAGFQVR